MLPGAPCERGADVLRGSVPEVAVPLTSAAMTQVSQY